MEKKTAETEATAANWEIQKQQVAEYNTRARKAFSEGEYEDALEYWDSALEIDPHSGESLFGVTCLRVTHAAMFNGAFKFHSKALKKAMEKMHCVVW